MRRSYPAILMTVLIAMSLVLPVMASSAVEPSSVPADKAHKLLVEGNTRFAADECIDHPLGLERRAELAKGQHPFAVIVTCSDSRVPPELIFDQGLGDVFVVRVAGNVLAPIELGSVEYAVEHLGCKLVVVLGHEKCGAVKATVDGGPVPPNIAAIAAKIKPAVDAAKTTHPKDLYEASTDFNIKNMVNMLNADSVLQHAGGVKVLGAKYHLESGKVTFNN